MKLGILKNNTIKSGVSYSFASTLSSLLTMLIGFLNMRWLGPELLGIWQSVTIVDSYLPIIQIGIQSGLNLELPILLGANEKDKAERFVATGLSFAIILASFFTLLSIIIISIVASHDCELNYLLSAIAVALIAIASCFRLHFIATYRSANAFSKLAKIYFVECFVSLLMIVIIYKYRYFGLLFYHVVEYLIVTALMWIFAPYRKIRPRFHLDCFKRLLERGIFMTIVNQIKGVIESLPRLILLKAGGVLMVGLFSPALAIGSFMNLFPNQVAQFLHPQMGYKYGQTRQAKDMLKYFKTLTIYVPLILLPIATVGWFLTPYVLEYFFPKYLDSLWPIRIMLIGFLFATTYFTRGFLITIKAYKEVVSLYVVDLILFALLPFTFIYYMKNDILISMSIGLSIAYFLTYFINIIIVKRTIFRNKYNGQA